MVRRLLIDETVGTMKESLVASGCTVPGPEFSSEVGFFTCSLVNGTSTLITFPADARYRRVFDKFPYFNNVQSQCIDDVCGCDVPSTTVFRE
jgi:hypothetical protein